MKHNAHKLSALIVALAVLLSMFAMAEDGGQEVIGLGGDIVIEGGAGDLELGMDAIEDPAGETEISLAAGETEISLDAGPGLEAGVPERVANGGTNDAGDGETWVAWEPSDRLPETSGNYTIDHSHGHRPGPVHRVRDRE